MRPVPVVFLRLAFSDQLYLRILAAGYPHEAQVFFWLWSERRPQRLQRPWVLVWRLPKLEVPLAVGGCQPCRRPRIVAVTVQPPSTVAVDCPCKPITQASRMHSQMFGSEERDGEVGQGYCECDHR